MPFKSHRAALCVSAAVVLIAQANPASAAAQRYEIGTETAPGACSIWRPIRPSRPIWRIANLPCSCG
ncbi:MAG: hypothetical protein M0R03_10130 [Novosphingobium sp.]|nr:hypothetical protein [Novosphingobium sp.]